MLGLVLNQCITEGFVLVLSVDNYDPAEWRGIMQSRSTRRSIWISTI